MNPNPTAKAADRFGVNDRANATNADQNKNVGNRSKTQIQINGQACGQTCLCQTMAMHMPRKVLATTAKPAVAHAIDLPTSHAESRIGDPNRNDSTRADRSRSIASVPKNRARRHVQNVTNGNDRAAKLPDVTSMVVSSGPGCITALIVATNAMMIPNSHRPGPRMRFFNSRRATE